MAPPILERDLSHIHNKARFMLSQLGIEYVVVGGEMKKYQAMESRTQSGREVCIGKPLQGKDSALITVIVFRV